MSSIEGFDKLVAKLNALGGDVNKALKVGIHQGMKLVQGDAKMLAPVNDGYLRNNIYGEVEAQDERIEGRVYTNVEYAPYVEFGTGPVGMASDKGDLPYNVLSQLNYKQNGWFIHESQIDEATATKYHFQKFVTRNGVFYYTEGQPAQPFLFPALRQNEQAIQKIVADNLRKEIRKLSGS